MTDRVDISEKVLNILINDVENITISAKQEEEDLTQLGMDSFIFIQVILSIENAFMIEFPNEYLILSEMNTIQKIVNAIINVIENNEV